MSFMKAATIALVVRPLRGPSPELVDVLSDDREISLLESEIDTGQGDPLKRVYEFRSSQTREDDEFADYVEELLSQPFVKPEIQEHGVQWLKSRIRIEQFQKDEADAARVIADYALKVLSQEPTRRDFLLAGPRAQIRVRIFVLEAQVLSDAA